jgi:TPR repeat protein
MTSPRYAPLATVTIWLALTLPAPLAAATPRAGAILRAYAQTKGLQSTQGCPRTSRVRSTRDAGRVAIPEDAHEHDYPPQIGLLTKPTTADKLEQHGCGAEAGITVEAVIPGGPAELAGLKRGDIVIRVEGRSVLGGDEIERAFGGRTAETHELTVCRGGAPLSFSVSSRLDIRWAHPLCANGLRDACLAMAQGLLQVDRRQAAQTMAKQLCNTGHHRGCRLLDQLLEKAEASTGRTRQVVRPQARRAPPPRKKQSERERLKARCERDEARACYLLANLWAEGTGGPANARTAREHYERACNAGSGDGCNVIGRQLHEGGGGLQDEARARGFYKRACQLGTIWGCFNLGLMLERGQGGPMDVVRARALYEQACAGANGRGCNNAGILHEKGQGGIRDERAARDRYTKACDQGFLWGCSNLGLLQASGRGGPKDELSARARFEQACQGGIGRACHELAVLLKDGRGGAKDLLKAAERYKQACASGYDRACESTSSRPR